MDVLFTFRPPAIKQQNENERKKLLASDTKRIVVNVQNVDKKLFQIQKMIKCVRVKQVGCGS